jgi:hypothetical protein
MTSTSRNPGRRGGFGKERDRLRVAQVAARLIVEHGLADWTLAKRKAARQLMLPDTTAMPSNDEIEVALAEHHALFGGEAHEESLRAMRAQALQWMDRLAEWQPLLVGGVAAGWATEHSDIRLELVADDPTAVEIELAGHGVADAALPAREGDAATHLMIESSSRRAGGRIRLAILTPTQRRNRPRKADEPRLDLEALSALMGPERSSP